MIEGEYKPWERRIGETVKWFGRFERFYLPLGSERSLEAAFRAWKTETEGTAAYISKFKQKRPSKSWYDAAAKWRWKERAEAWDKYQRDIKLQEEALEKLDWQNKRRQLMTAYFAKIAGALSRLDKIENPRLSELTQAIKIMLDQNRLEYGLPTEISETQIVYDLEWRDTNEN